MSVDDVSCPRRAGERTDVVSGLRGEGHDPTAPQETS